MIGLHLCVTVPLAIVLNIWIDEAYSLMTTSRGIAFVLENSREFQHYPPLYYIQLWFWRTLDGSIVFARLNSVLTVAAALWVIHLSARRWLPSVSSLWIVGPSAFNVYVIYAATEIRAYAMVILLTALLFLFFHDGFYSEATKRRSRVLFSLAALASLYTFYYLGFLLVALPAVLLFERRWKALGPYLGWIALVAVLWLPGLLRGSADAAAISQTILDMPGLMRTLTFVGARIVSMPFSLTIFASGIRWAVVIPAVIFVLVSLWRYRNSVTPRVRALWIVTAGLALCYALVVQFVMGEDVHPRHSIVLIVPATFAIVSAAGLPGRGRVRLLAAWAIAAIVCNVTASFIKFSPLAKVGDYRRVSQYLEEHERPGESIVIAASHAELPLRHYYRGDSSFRPLPEQDDYANYEVAEWRLDPGDDVSGKLAAAVSDEGLLWVLTDRPPDTVFLGLDLNLEYLESLLKSDYDLLSERDFYVAKVRLFRARNLSGSYASNK